MLPLLTVSIRLHLMCSYLAHTEQESMIDWWRREGERKKAQDFLYLVKGQIEKKGSFSNSFCRFFFVLFYGLG